MHSPEQKATHLPRTVFAAFHRIPYICRKNDAMQQRAYTIKEIAVKYFPTIEPHNASRRLRMWIAEDKELTDELLRLGYRNSQRLLSWACVKAILKRFGDVYETD